MQDAGLLPASQNRAQLLTTVNERNSLAPNRVGDTAWQTKGSIREEEPWPAFPKPSPRPALKGWEGQGRL